jgi:hypothetical protein
MVDTTAPRAKPFDEVYREQVANGLKPSWTCKDNKEFGDYFQGRLGHRLWLKFEEVPAVTKLLGVSFTGGVSETTIGVLAKVEDQPVIVLADRAATRWEHPMLKYAQGLHVYQRQVGQLVLYEVSPFSEPRLLDLFMLPPG